MKYEMETATKVCTRLRTDVSDEHAASFFRVQRVRERDNC
jgi:hypothetical protein